MKKQKPVVTQFNLFSNLSINEKINLKSWNISKHIKEIILSKYDNWFDDTYFTKRDYIQWKKSDINRKWVKGWKL
jgi:hypothetical protein